MLPPQTYGRSKFARTLGCESWSSHRQLNRGPRPNQGLRSERCGARLAPPSKPRQIMVWWGFGSLRLPRSSDVRGRSGDPDCLESTSATVDTT